ncbi:MAG TPA: DinB family protein [Bryobacteraceae bacterium]|nr:DinB family protein [Bryobacteraceae bacterium]
MAGLKVTTLGGEPLSVEGARIVEYLETRTGTLTPEAIRDRVRASATQFENAAAVTEEQARSHPIAGKWSIAEIVDHVAQTQIRSAEELRHLVAGRRPPFPPVYEGLRSGAPEFAPWPELLEGLHAANHEVVAVLDAALSSAQAPRATVDAVVVVTRTLDDGRTAPQRFVVELGWREYGLFCRMHLVDHSNQIKKLVAAAAVAESEVYTKPWNPS